MYYGELLAVVGACFSFSKTFQSIWDTIDYNWIFYSLMIFNVISFTKLSL